MQDKNTTSVYNENIVQEIMGLVSHAMDRAMWAGELILDEDRAHFERRFEEGNDARLAIESKLRELVENKFPVQKPLSDEQIDALWVFCGDLSVPQKVQRRMIVRTTEAAHGITK